MEIYLIIQLLDGMFGHGKGYGKSLKSVSTQFKRMCLLMKLPQHLAMKIFFLLNIYSLITKLNYSITKIIVNVTIQVAMYWK